MFNKPTAVEYEINGVVSRGYVIDSLEEQGKTLLLIADNPNHNHGTWVECGNCEEFLPPHPSQTLSCFV